MGKKLGIGLMSGTSLDGIDAVLIEIEGTNSKTEVKVKEFISHTYTKEIRKELMEICSPSAANLEKICSMNMYLGKEFGRIVQELLTKAKVKKEEVLFISSHGQTIYHKPVPGENYFDVAGTLQIGDLSVLSEFTGITAVGDFRTADMAAGGQGAPLVSFVDYILFQDESVSRAVQNIGGIGNVTYIPRNAKEEEIQSFDTGPGNMVIDEIVFRLTNAEQTYDRNGAIASEGKVHEKFLNQLMEHQYFSLAPPKTTGRELFGKSFVDELVDAARQYSLSEQDIVATVTAWTAKTISYSYYEFIEGNSSVIDEVIIGGGGSYNPFLMAKLQEYLPGKKVYTHEDFGISSDLKEAVAFAILGYHCLCGKYNQSPSATGAKNPVIMGKIAYTQPQAYQRLLSSRGN